MGSQGAQEVRLSNQMMQQQIGVACFLVVISTFAVSNLFMFRRLDRCREATRKPFVSVLLPMRNEERNAEACIRSLLSQEYPAFELLVLDDESTDCTWDIVCRLAAEDPRVVAVKGLPLPGGWLGKHWACHQLAMAAKGEVLLFTDADTRHAPDSLAAGVNALVAEGADMVTAFPREEMRTPGEKAGIPILAFSFLAFMPLALAYRGRPRSFAVAIGQYMLFRRESYFAVGGHEAVKDEVLDDFELAKNIKAAGLRWLFLDGQRQVSCRMYSGWREVYRGLGKNLFAVFGYHAAAFFFIWLWMLMAFVVPPVLLALGLSGMLSPSLAWLAAANAALALFLWSLTVLLFRYPLYLAPLYPLVVGNAVAMSFYSMWITVSGRWSWKGRRLARKRFHWL